MSAEERGEGAGRTGPEKAARRQPDAADESSPSRRRTGVGATSPGSTSRSIAPDATGPATSAPGTPMRRLFWFGALWLAGVAAVSLVAFVIRSVIGS